MSVASTTSISSNTTNTNNTNDISNDGALTDLQLAELRKAFACFDTDGSGLCLTKKKKKIC
jgi:Ca2+-binding EF-hand superfamily protein